jgi:hypothetical protein
MKATTFLRLLLAVGTTGLLARGRRRLPLVTMMMPVVERDSNQQVLSHVFARPRLLVAELPLCCRPQWLFLDLTFATILV